MAQVTRDGAGTWRPAGSCEGPSPRVSLAGAAVRRVRTAQDAAHDAGMATAEYAIATLAAVGFAGLLLVVLKGNEVKSLLSGIVRQALGG